MNRLPISHLWLGLAAALTLTACQTRIPALDTTPPTLTLSLHDGPLQRVGSTDPEAPAQLGCPPGQHFFREIAAAYVQGRYGYRPSFSADAADSIYFYGGYSPPFRFVLVVSDPGGVALAQLSVADRTISPTAPEGLVRTRDLLPATARSFTESRRFESGSTYTYRTVEQRGERSDPRSALLTSVSLSALGDTPMITVSGSDFSGNSRQMLVWLLPDTLCR